MLPSFLGSRNGSVLNFAGFGELMLTANLPVGFDFGLLVVVTKFDQCTMFFLSLTRARVRSVMSVLIYPSKFVKTVGKCKILKSFRASMGNTDTGFIWSISVFKEIESHESSPKSLGS